MQLLQPKQHQQNKEREDAIKRIRTAELEKEYEDKLRLLNILNDDFEKALEAQKDTYAKEKDVHALWRADTEADVKELEARKATALLPITERENAVTIKEEKLRTGFNLLEKAKGELDEEKELMYKRLDEVGERETQVKRSEEFLTTRKHGIDVQAENLKLQSKQWSKTFGESVKSTAEREQEYQARKAILDARGEALDMKEARLSSMDKELANRERALADRYETLQRTITRLKK